MLVDVCPVGFISDIKDHIEFIEGDGPLRKNAAKRAL